jgi:hypothetical protein
MKRFIIIASTLLFIGIAVFVFLPKWSNESPNFESVSSQQEGVVNTKPVDTTLAMPQTLKPKALPKEELPSDGAIFKAQFSQIADNYMDTAQFPVGSQPIRNPADVYEPAPFELAQFSIPFPMQGGGTLKVSAALDRFLYFAGDTIAIKVTVEGAPVNAYVEVDSQFSSSKEDLQTPVELSSKNGALFEGSVDTSTVSDSSFTPEMLLKALITVDGEEFFITQGFRYFQASADVIGIGRVEANGANLDIPVELDVEESGYYFLRAVLEDAETKKQLIALQSEGRLAKGSRKLMLQAHIQALKFSGSEGPYNLTNIKLYRGANEEEEFDVPGKTREKKYKVQGFSFDRYDDVDHVDPIALERAEFLRSLGK